MILRSFEALSLRRTWWARRDERYCRGFGALLWSEFCSRCFSRLRSGHFETNFVCVARSCCACHDRRCLWTCRCPKILPYSKAFDLWCLYAQLDRHLVHWRKNFCYFYCLSREHFEFLSLTSLRRVFHLIASETHPVASCFVVFSSKS